MKNAKSIIFIIFTVLFVQILSISCSNGGSTANPGPTPTPIECTNSVGYPIDQSYNTSLAAGYIGGNKFSVPSEITIHGLNALLTKTSKCIIAVYDDNSGEPGTLLASTGVVTGKAEWNRFAVPDTVIPSGQEFWIVCTSEVSAVEMYNSGAATVYKHFEYPWSSSLAGGIGEHTGWASSIGEIQLYACFEFN